MSYNQLTENERYQIYTLKKAGYSQVDIAEKLERHPSTISRELRRNNGLMDYRPGQAQKLTDARRNEAGKANGGDLYTHLRVASKPYRKRYGSNIGVGRSRTG